ncbi:Intradiol ring-cleavage dioxygenase [Kalaharituber pfeilii]|nr:Intradiol ring-cleavage dioxygenase [Kalaharituber pfeilii]
MKFTNTFLSSLFLALLSTELVSAHGAMKTPAELAKRAEHIANSRRSLEKCGAKLRTRERLERRMMRRNALVQEFVELKKREAGVDISVNPALRKRDLSGQVVLDSLFPNPPVCVLAPELAVGPFYAPNMLIRSDIREDIPGIELLLALEIVDVNTCEVVPNVMVDFWHCTSLGVYSAFEVEGTAGETFLRGLQPTGEDGIVTVTSIVPGWYQGRTTHIHIAAHTNGTITGNGDYYTIGQTSHIGQLFFPESVIEQIETLEPYTSNTNTRVTNAEDGYYNEEAGTGYEADMDIHFIDENDWTKGVAATMVVGIDTAANHSLEWGSGGGPDGAGGPDGTVNTTTTNGTQAPPVQETGGSTVLSVRGMAVAAFSILTGLFLGH